MFLCQKCIRHYKYIYY